MNTQDFIRDFIHNDKAVYVDLGNYDFGASDEKVYIRDKLNNEVSQLKRKGIQISHEKRVNPSYYIAAIGLLVMAFYFSVFFMRDALGNDIWIVAVLILYISPFVMRLFTSGFRIVALYFALCTVFALTVGSWQENNLGSGVIIFYVVGIMPYIASRVFSRIWTESHLVLSSGGKEIRLRCGTVKVNSVLKALGQWGTTSTPKV